ncbi:MFS transporter [Nocardia sp. NPDC057353]|uniref:MFS transporter n=1 Tax=Nocardia sp. NPDC057353 TaxID=3346104 RepID=UPI003626E3AD
MNAPIATARAAPGLPALATVLAAAALTLMAAAVIAPALPAMATAYAGTPGAELLVRLAVGITSLAIAVSAPLAGALADRVGRASLLTGGLLLYAVSGTAGWFLTGLPALLGSRILLGIAVGAVMTAVAATLTDWYEGPRRALWLGRQQAAASLGGVVFLPLAGVLAGIDWRLPFWLHAAAAPIAVAAALLLRDGPPAAPNTPDPVRGQGNTAGILGIYLLALTATLAFFMAPTQLPFLLTEQGAGPAAVGVIVAGSTLTSIAGALLFPRLRARLTPTAVTAASLALLGLGWLVAGTAAHPAQVLAGLLIGGLGVGAVVPDLNTRLGELAPPHRRGRVLSGLVTAIFLGQFLSPVVLAPLVARIGIEGAFTTTGLALLGAGFLLQKGRKS